MLKVLVFLPVVGALRCWPFCRYAGPCRCGRWRWLVALGGAGLCAVAGRAIRCGRAGAADVREPGVESPAWFLFCARCRWYFAGHGAADRAPFADRRADVAAHGSGGDDFISCWCCCSNRRCSAYFMARDWSLFYVFWEATLLPLFFLIDRLGGPNRQRAALNFFLYTLGWLGVHARRAALSCMTRRPATVLPWPTWPRVGAACRSIRNC